ncbi:hypothetical protein [Nostoc sp. C117]|uniref:hypothetical protein n=1 Tax=Nostoc sp. C117 TaxID=3349875 RepID=UPI00370DC7C8
MTFNRQQSTVNDHQEYLYILDAHQLKIPIGHFAQIHILYPETEKTTKTFILMYSQVNNPLMKLFFKNSVLQAVATIIEQDTGAVESLYPWQKLKIRLPNEEIMFYAEKLYHNW